MFCEPHAVTGVNGHVVYMLMADKIVWTAFEKVVKDANGLEREAQILPWCTSFGFHSEYAQYL